MALDSALAAQLHQHFPGAAFTMDAAECLAYGYDNSRRQAQPDAVVFPTTHEQVVALVQACRTAKTALTVRGRGTNTTGATVPVAGGVVASFERMNRILSINANDRYAVVEPGVLNGDLQTALAEYGFFWPPDPTSSPFCTVGGNLACNAAGPRAVKYGSCRENVLGLRAVTGYGEAFECGVYTTKGATGYDLTRLLIGSEGTLAIITRATLKISPKPAAKRTLRAIYTDVAAAAAAVARIMAQPITPCALEFLDGQSLRLARAHGGAAIPEGDAMLIVEVDGAQDQVADAVQAVAQSAGGIGALDVRVATSSEDVAILWAARKALSPALRTLSPNKINEDVVVPVSRLPELIDSLGDISRKHQIDIVGFGHAGNGNIHVNLLPRDDAQRKRAEQALADVFDTVINLDGTLSGEHGIGLAKREFLSRALDPVALDLMCRIKRQFDPEGILNPGKLLP
ncbi:MAG TPA: FAD-linked oxidase C-terminal domain-containing protein [Rudaea sp.]|nr:FAD-linked oxidase C-terminal domain-containing protein [Rudaea sp.]